MIRKIIKIVKMIGIAIVSIIALILIVGLLFINLSPQFGGKASKEQQEIYAKSGHYDQKENKFVNLITTTMDAPSFKLMMEFFKKDPKRQPSHNLEPQKVDSLTLATHDDIFTKLTWFGHSAFLLQMEGKNILLDPMLGETPSPHPLLGSKRYAKELPIEVEKLPIIDAIIFSHDHYDHLDYGTIQKLKSRVKNYYVPLGIGNHLKSWGVEEEKIHELNWWDTISLDSVQLVLTPSRHFSGRGLTDRNATLWGSWVIKGQKDNIYFSGDGGYGPHFKEIGEKYGPFDMALMECGQYNESWHAIHMMPEETVQAGIDVKGKVVLPIHWGAFTLALHSWTDPIERAIKKGKELNIPIVTPKVGQKILVNSNDYPQEKWWVGQ